jgi:hypothetical protein
VSQFPRRVLTDTSVSWDPHANGASRATFTRHGTVIDIIPGSTLEAAYGGSGNLSAVIPEASRGDGTNLDKACVSN